jgi:hypothetical protein
VFKKSLLFEIFGAHDDYNKFVVKSVKILFYKFLFPYCEVDLLPRHDGKAARGKYPLDPVDLLNSFHKKKFLTPSASIDPATSGRWGRRHRKIHHDI